MPGVPPPRRTGRSPNAAAPVYTGGGGGSGELEVIVELRRGDSAVYVSWGNFTRTGENDAQTLLYRGEVSRERLTEMRDAGLL